MKLLPVLYALKVQSNASTVVNVIDATANMCVLQVMLYRLYEEQSDRLSA